MSRVGQVFMWLEGSWALVTEDLGPTRRPGSTVPGTGHKSDPDSLVYTVCVFDRSGAVHWPVERLASSLERWELEGRRLA